MKNKLASTDTRLSLMVLEAGPFSLQYQHRTVASGLCLGIGKHETLSFSNAAPLTAYPTGMLEYSKKWKAFSVPTRFT